MISQSGGLGFAFFDRARGRNLAFRHIVTTGNEAVLEASDLIDTMLDEGKTDVFLLLLEDIKTPEKFRRVADKALRAGKPLIVAKIGQTEPAAAQSRRTPRHLPVRTPPIARSFRAHGVIEGDDFDEMIDLAAGFLACGNKLPAGQAHGDMHRRRAAPACGWRTPACARASRCRSLTRQRAQRSTCICRSYGTSQNPIDSTAQGVHKLGYAAFARLAAQSPLIDGVMVVVTARRSAFLADDQPKLTALAQRNAESRCSCGPTRCPRTKSVEIAQRGRLSAVHQRRRLARAPCARWPTIASLRERLLRRPKVKSVIPAAGSRRRAGDACGIRLRAVRMAGAAGARRLWHRRR